MAEDPPRVDCPALHYRAHAKGYPFGDRVPARIRMLRRVAPCGLIALSRRAADEPVNVAYFGEEYPAWTNSYGAVAAVFTDGSNLGVCPGEFEVVAWHELGGSS
jgi:hypothetical protein